MPSLSLGANTTRSEQWKWRYVPTKSYNIEDADTAFLFQTTADEYKDGDFNFIDNDWAIHFWIKPTDDDNVSPLFTHATASTGLEIILDSDEKVVVIFHSASDDTYTASSACTAGSWNHVVVTYDKSATTLKCYLNNSEVISDTSATLTGITSNSMTFLQGSLQSNGEDQYYEGRVFEIAIYNQYLSASNVGTLYNSGDPFDLRKHSFIPQGWWTMGDFYTDIVKPQAAGSLLSVQTINIMNTQDDGEVGRLLKIIPYGVHSEDLVDDKPSS